MQANLLDTHEMPRVEQPLQENPSNNDLLLPKSDSEIKIEHMVMDFEY